eukprot:TRINITY_DN72415_c0_g1_i1.p1 TRINITY_DN72415_c0_g1~~TRINITY_DN72415_c0_g1_i1.p1  ORF type:complete len:574 (-),score=154.90 TRINITY_DN72415_c0_g1_i1:124-1845(-)
MGLRRSRASLPVWPASNVCIGLRLLSLLLIDHVTAVTYSAEGAEGSQLSAEEVGEAIGASRFADLSRRGARQTEGAALQQALLRKEEQAASVGRYDGFGAQGGDLDSFGGNSTGANANAVLNGAKGEANCPCLANLKPPGKPHIKGEKIAIYPDDIGTSCDVWDGGRYPGACTGSDTSKFEDGQEFDWCFQKWCYVDPCNCVTRGAHPEASAYFPSGKTPEGRPLYYSYATCGSKDHWTQKNYPLACQTQKFEEDCNELPNKCTWTGTRCLGKELADEKACPAGSKVLGGNGSTGGSNSAAGGIASNADASADGENGTVDAEQGANGSASSGEEAAVEASSAEAKEKEGGVPAVVLFVLIPLQIIAQLIFYFAGLRKKAKEIEQKYPAGGLPGSDTLPGQRAELIFALAFNGMDFAKLEADEALLQTYMEAFKNAVIGQADSGVELEDITVALTAADGNHEVRIDLPTPMAIQAAEKLIVALGHPLPPPAPAEGEPAPPEVPAAEVDAENCAMAIAVVEALIAIEGVKALESAELMRCTSTTPPEVPPMPAVEEPPAQEETGGAKDEAALAEK